MYYLNAYGHWLVTKNINKGELVIQCTDQGDGKPVKKEVLIFGETEQERKAREIFCNVMHHSVMRMFYQGI